MMWQSLACLALLPALAWGQAPPEPKVTRAALQEAVDAVRKATRVPALGAAIVTSKGMHCVAVSGTRKILTKAPLVTVDDQWHLGSDSKAFTAMLLEILAEKGALKTTATMEELFPKSAKKMQEAYRKVTLDDLLRHRGGLPANLSSKPNWGLPATLSLPAQRLEAAARGLALKPAAEPGEKHHYSNLGYVVAAAAAEQATKQPYEKLIQERVFTPLGIKDAGFGPMGTPGKLDQPLQHDAKGVPREPLPVNDNPAVMTPATRIHMSLGSWALFLQDHLAGARGKGKLLSSAGYKRLQTPEKGEGYTRGGWVVESDGGVLIYTHDGSNAGNYCRAVFIPYIDFGLLIVTNVGPKPGKDAVDSLMEKVKAIQFARPKASGP
jgi:CubicO group peptidase (beta-lactamase class C family)